MTSKRKRKLFIIIPIFVVVLAAVMVLLTGCIQGMSPIGWSGIAINENGIALIGSKQGRLVSVDLSNRTLLYAEPLAQVASGGIGCAPTCGSTPAVAIYGTPALTSSVPVGVDNSGKPVSGTIAIIAGYNGKIVAYQSNALGNKVWEYPQGNFFLRNIVSAVVVSGTTAYFGDTDGNVYALDTSGDIASKTTTEKWHFQTGGQIWASPAVDAENNTVIISSFDKNIYAIDASTGKEKWRFPTATNNVATAIIFDGTVYVGSLDRNFYAINENDPTDFKKFTANGWFWTTPVASNGIIYAPNLDSKVYALEAKTLNLVKAYDVGGQVSSTPVIVNNQLIVATKNKKLWSIDISNPATAVPRMITAIPDQVTSPLASNGNNVYINAPDNKIYGYDIITGATIEPINLTVQ